MERDGNGACVPIDLTGVELRTTLGTTQATSFATLAPRVE